MDVQRGQIWKITVGKTTYFDRVLKINNYGNVLTIDQFGFRGGIPLEIFVSKYELTEYKSFVEIDKSFEWTQKNKRSLDQ